MQLESWNYCRHSELRAPSGKTVQYTQFRNCTILYHHHSSRIPLSIRLKHEELCWSPDPEKPENNRESENISVWSSTSYVVRRTSYDVRRTRVRVCIRRKEKMCLLKDHIYIVYLYERRGPRSAIIQTTTYVVHSIRTLTTTALLFELMDPYFLCCTR